MWFEVYSGCSGCTDMWGHDYARGDLVNPDLQAAAGPSKQSRKPKALARFPIFLEMLH